MAVESPSSILGRAADLIRDTAASTTPGQWLSNHHYVDSMPELYVRHPVCTAAKDTDARWIALLSPAVSPMIESWIRETASYFDEFGEYWVTVPEQARNALAFARTVLGVQEEVSDGS